VHDEREQDNGQDGDDHPEKEHDDAGNGNTSYGSRSSSHGGQLPSGLTSIRGRCSLGQHIDFEHHTTQASPLAPPPWIARRELQQPALTALLAGSTARCLRLVSVHSGVAWVGDG
jgi:hypothetical protein